MAGPVEAKVQAGTGAAAVSGLALWALGHYVLKDGVPDVIASWVYVIVPGLLTFAAGYLARHTPRPAAARPVMMQGGGGGGGEYAVMPSNVTVTRPEKTLLSPAPGSPPSVPELLAPPVAPPPAAPE
jgi:hypothetical protein